MGVGIGQIGQKQMNMFAYGNNHYNNPHNNLQNNIQNNKTNPDIKAMKRLLSLNEKESDKRAEYYGSNVASSSMEYANSLSSQRASKKDTSLKLKKLKYDFKGMSAQIMRSKTSFSAKQVASKARREVAKLKRQSQSKEYDDEEIQAAISHDQAMERVAKKKAKHLLEEERVKVTGKPGTGDVTDAEDETDKLEEELSEEDEVNSAEAYEEQEAMQEEMQAEMEAMQEEMQIEMEAMQEQMRIEMEAMQEQMQAEMETMQDEFQSEMQDMLEETGLSELLDEMTPGVEREMDSDDYKMMKIKHRAEENKALAKADSEYLKTMFQKYESEKSGNANQTSAGVSNGSVGGGGFVGGMGGVSFDTGVNISVPSVDFSGAAMSGFDVSV